MQPLNHTNIASENVKHCGTGTLSTTQCTWLMHLLLLIY